MRYREKYQLLTVTAKDGQDVIYVPRPSGCKAITIFPKVSRAVPSVLRFGAMPGGRSLPYPVRWQDRLK
jgi:hypothetical protein